MKHRSSKSLFDQHIDQLEGHNQLVNDEECSRVQEFHAPPPLRFPSSTSSFPFKNIFFTMVVASLVSLTGYHLIFKNNVQPSFTIKGPTQITVIFERNGKFSELSPQNKLKSGDQFTFEIAAGSNLYVYASIINKGWKHYLAPNEIMNNSFFIKQGVVKQYSKSYKLVGQNDKETLIIATCKNQPLEKSDVLHVFSKEYQTTTRSYPCQRWIFSLR